MTGVTRWAPLASYGSDHWWLCFRRYSIHGTLVVSSEQGYDSHAAQQERRGDDYCSLKALVG